jgi:hypothetical protein
MEMITAESWLFQREMIMDKLIEKVVYGTPLTATTRMFKLEMITLCPIRARSSILVSGE